MKLSHRLIAVNTEWKTQRPSIAGWVRKIEKIESVRSKYHFSGAKDVGERAYHGGRNKW